MSLKWKVALYFIPKHIFTGHIKQCSLTRLKIRPLFLTCKSSCFMCTSPVIKSALHMILPNLQKGFRSNWSPYVGGGKTQHHASPGPEGWLTFVTWNKWLPLLNIYNQLFSFQLWGHEYLAVRTRSCKSGHFEVTVRHPGSARWLKWQLSVLCLHVLMICVGLRDTDIGLLASS